MNKFSIFDLLALTANISNAQSLALTLRSRFEALKSGDIAYIEK